MSGLMSGVGNIRKLTCIDSNAIKVVYKSVLCLPILVSSCVCKLQSINCGLKNMFISRFVNIHQFVCI
jgi:hypothetical protein